MRNRKKKPVCCTVIGQERSITELKRKTYDRRILTRSKIVKVKQKYNWKRANMRISDLIAGFIDEVLGDMGGTAELQRAELANRFNCVPSQINYVIATRFSPEHGYIVESRRGGGGFIRITRVAVEPEQLIMHTVNAIGSNVDINTAAALIANLRQGSAINGSEARLILSAIGNNALRPAQLAERDILRASILKHMLINKL
jgi:transcriptional regulator CtsR